MEKFDKALECLHIIHEQELKLKELGFDFKLIVDKMDITFDELFEGASRDFVHTLGLRNHQS